MRQVTFGILLAAAIVGIPSSSPAEQWGDDEPKSEDSPASNSENERDDSNSEDSPASNSENERDDSNSEDSTASNSKDERDDSNSEDSTASNSKDERDDSGGSNQTSESASDDSEARDDRGGESDNSGEVAASDSSGSAESSQSESPSMFDPPSAYTVGAGLSSAILFWDTPYRGAEFEFMAVGTIHGRIAGPLIASANLGFARRAPTAGALQAANNHFAGLAGIGGEFWAQTVRFSAQMQAGVLYRNMQLSDDDKTYFSSRLVPTFGGRASIGTTFFDGLLVSLVNGARYYPTKRFEYYVALEVGWLFVHGE